MAIRAMNAAPVRASHLALVPPQATTFAAGPAFPISSFLSLPVLFFLAPRAGEPPGPRVAPAMSSRLRGPYRATSAARDEERKSAFWCGVDRHALGQQ
ncbi:hypothetical protein BDA96_01G432500 [Sorghum bicolor]|uniref:Uncharacterized protein n=1 Tax=Sorghum bicolor TaxID=4558 RepID=A0A921S3N7_SORBI|nr:hypothetical protein BDA96_01G432500 [Sorghum bicolor]